MGRFVGKQADGYETRIGRLLPGYELLHLLFVLPSRYFQAVGYQAWIAFRAG